MHEKSLTPRRVAALGMAIAFFSCLCVPPESPACSRVFINDRDIAKIVVRTMDLPLIFPENPRLVVLPRGMHRKGGQGLLPGKEMQLRGVTGKQLEWVSKNGSLVVTGFDVMSTDGLNEHGLAAHIQALSESRTEPDDARDQLGDVLWVQYVLDNFTTVREVVDAHGKGLFRIVPAWAPEAGYGQPLGLHLAVEDPTGDSAIIEFVNGKMAIYHGPQYRVMTNDPNMGEMLERLKGYRGFGGERPIPGAPLEGEYRFVRLAEAYKYLPNPRTSMEAVAGAFSLIRTAQIPFRDPARDPDARHGVWTGMRTDWTSVSDLTRKAFFFESSMGPGLMWIELQRLKFDAGSSILWLNPHDPAIRGDAVGGLVPWRG